MVPAPKEFTDGTGPGGGVGLQRDNGKCTGLGRSQEPWELLPAPLPMSLETLGKALIFSEPQFSHLLNGDNKT